MKFPVISMLDLKIRGIVSKMIIFFVRRSKYKLHRHKIMQNIAHWVFILTMGMFLVPIILFYKFTDVSFMVWATVAIVLSFWNCMSIIRSNEKFSKEVYDILFPHRKNGAVQRNAKRLIEELWAGMQQYRILFLKIDLTLFATVDLFCLLGSIVFNDLGGTLYVIALVINSITNMMDRYIHYIFDFGSESDDDKEPDKDLTKIQAESIKNQLAGLPV